MFNKLYTGDNYDIMRLELADKSVDLVATDPPFFTQRDHGDFNDTWFSLDYYLDFMQVRLIQMHRILKDTGSLYLHCDMLCSHYLKGILDHVFGHDCFRREIIWALQRASGFKTNANNWVRNHDIILYYRKSDEFTFNKQYEIIDGKKYPLSSVWSDIHSMQSQGVSAKEGVSYATQKPQVLYERIIRASSNPDDVVLDPFCGSGTTLAAAKTLQRQYIGIDQNERAIEIAKTRLHALL